MYNTFQIIRLIAGTYIERNKMQFDEKSSINNKKIKIVINIRYVLEWNDSKIKVNSAKVFERTIWYLNLTLKIFYIY